MGALGSSIDMFPYIQSKKNQQLVYLLELDSSYRMDKLGSKGFLGPKFQSRLLSFGTDWCSVMQTQALILNSIQ